MNIQLTKKQMRSFLIGTILGDSSMTGKVMKSIVVGHTEPQYDYLLLKQAIIEGYCPVGSTIKEKINKTGYQLYSTSHHKLTAIYNLIYSENRKVISKELLSKMDEVGLAALFMDDGCKETKVLSDGRRVIANYKFSIHSFPREQVELLSSWILETYAIESKVYLKHEKYPVLKITKHESKEKFSQLIEPFVVESMRYKLYI